MASYKIVIGSQAEKALKKIPKKDLARVVSAIQNLASDPFPPFCRKLAGEDSAYRIRQGVYRIIYEVRGRELLILVLKIGHRKDVYR
ncbi:MAG: type II toxin-antitoxin system RelE/ParE family toxin [Bdellovibrionales bacterium]